MLTISRGRIPSAKKIVIYGVEGIGKSTLAAQFPDPVFIDTEGSTKEMDVKRFDPPSSWPMLISQVQYVIDHPDVCRTLVLDTADWAEQLMIRHICAQRGWTGLEDPGYGKGYQYAAEEWGGQLLNRLSEVAARGVNVVVTAHAWLRKVDLPEEAASYDHWEMKTSRKVAPMLREWADGGLFLHYETIVVKNAEKKAKAQGGRRVIETTHTPYWDAKNRWNLPEKLPLDFGQIAHLFQDGLPAPQQQVAVEPLQIPLTNTPPIDTRVPPTPPELPPAIVFAPITDPDPNLSFTGPGPEAPPPPVPQNLPDPPISNGIPAALWDLMTANGVTEQEIQAAVGHVGYFPADMPIRNYPADFVEGCLIGAWDSLFAHIKNARGGK